jgi:hypothetical protein
MWTEYFTLKGLKPGRVVTALFGEVDFARPDLPLEKVKALYESDFPYLEPTVKGLTELYNIPTEKLTPQPPSFSTSVQSDFDEESICEKPTFPIRKSRKR